MTNSAALLIFAFVCFIFGAPAVLTHKQGWWHQAGAVALGIGIIILLVIGFE